MTDVFFAAKIHDTAKKLGVPVKLVRGAETLATELKMPPLAVIFDLNCGPIDAIALIRDMKSNPATSNIGTIGFVSHVQEELKRAAQESGCDLVVARSVFAQRLPEILRRYADVETASRS